MKLDAQAKIVQEVYSQEIKLLKEENWILKMNNVLAKTGLGYTVDEKMMKKINRYEAAENKEA